MNRLRTWLLTQAQQRRDRREALTRQVAHRLWLNRQARNRQGDAATDWARAQRLVRRPWNRAAFRFTFWWRQRVEDVETNPIEAGLEGLVNDLSNLAVVDLLGILASLSLITGAVGYFMDADERKKQTHYQAWGVINSAVGREAESGRRSAIEELWADNVSLVGLDIHNAVIPGLNLSPQCHFVGVQVPMNVCNNFSRFPFVNLSQAYLRGANLERADLENANLEGAYLWEANLAGADLIDANLERAYLIDANLAGAYLENANLAGADLENANLEGVVYCNTTMPDGAVKNDDCPPSED